jgi:rhodanese-related sulfurtransferase
MNKLMHTAIDLVDEVLKPDVNADMEEKEFAVRKDHCVIDAIIQLTERGNIKPMKDGLYHPEDKVTTEQFVTMIIKSSKEDIEPTRVDWSSGYIDYALYHGIIEDYDMTNLKNPIERRSAARIIHEALLTEFSERDEEDWSVAEKLKDLYSCHTCVMHIAQVYAKGIMLGREDNVFDVKGNLSLSEASAIVVRVLNKGERMPQTRDRMIKSTMLHPDEAWDLLKDHRSMLVDVRTQEEFNQGHIDGSICIPLRDISNNPFAVCIRKDTPIILYCQMGYKSSLAAHTLIEAGYSKIYTIPGTQQYRYKLTGDKQ